MKKRILAVFAALVLCLSVLASAFPVGAAETPHFVAVDINLLPLKEQYIPIIADGMYYVPYQVLDVSSNTGIDLGIYPVYNSAIRTLTIYNREKVIAFDLSAGTCSDRDGTIFSARAVTRNGQVYVPAKFICDYFGLKYTYFPETKYGPMIRIYTSSSRLNDDYFLAAAQMMMEDRLNDWRKDQAAQATPTPSAAASTRPSATTTTSARPTTTSPKPTEPAVDKSDVRTYLAFRADQLDGLASLLNRLEYYHIQAMFFFPADELAQYDEAIRRVLCGGHGVGLMTSETSSEEIISDVAEGNRILRQIAYFGAYTILLPDGADADVLAEVRGSGLLVWEPDVDALPNGKNVSVRAASVLAQAERYKEKVNILSDCSSSASALMSWLMPALVEDQYDLRLAVETEI